MEIPGEIGSLIPRSRRQRLFLTARVSTCRL
jgi:hypothetical protein